MTGRKAARHPKSAKTALFLAPLLVLPFVVLLALAAPLPSAAAQTAANPPAATGTAPRQAPKPRGKTVKGKRRPTVKPPDQTIQPMQPTAVAAAPPVPKWPVNDMPVPASVDWNGRILSISASNSSLKQILADVSLATGVKVEGSPNDQRVFGSYGPAPARDVLSQLLDGTGYNVLMIGDQGEGAPRTLVLTVKSSQPAGNQGPNAQPRGGADDEAQEEPEPAEQDPGMHRQQGFPPGQNRNQIMQEMEQRRLQQQQQLQQQQGAPVQPPVPPGQPQQY